MTLPLSTFPMPDEEQNLNALGDSLHEITQGHMAVLGGLQSGLIQQLTPIQQHSDDIERALMQAANRAGRTPDAALKKLGGALETGVNNTLGEVNANYNSTMANLPQSPTYHYQPEGGGAAAVTYDQTPENPPPPAAMQQEPVGGGGGGGGGGGALPAGVSIVSHPGVPAGCTVTGGAGWNTPWPGQPSDTISYCSPDGKQLAFVPISLVNSGWDSSSVLPGWQLCGLACGNSAPPESPPPAEVPYPTEIAPAFPEEETPTPTPTPPPPSSCNQVTVETMQHAPGTPWLAVATMVYDELVLIGKDLIDCEGDGLGKTAVELLQKYWFRDSDATWPSNVKADLASALSHNPRPDWWVRQRTAALGWPGSFGRDVLYLSALKSVLEEVRAIAIHWGNAGQWGTHKGYGFGASAEIVSYEQGDNAALHDHLEVARAIRPIVVFQIEVVDKCLVRARSAEKPTRPEAMDALLLGRINRSEYRDILSWDGSDDRDFEPMLEARSEHLMTDELIQWCRRNGMTRDQTLAELRVNGWYRENQAQRREELYDELPTISDHLLWLQKNADDDQYVKQYNLLDGFAPDDRIRQLPGMSEYKTLYNPTNRDFWRRFGKDLRAQGMKEEYAALHYAAHWILPPMGTMFEMVRRLRPGRVPKEIEFTEQDLFRLMGEQDIAPWFRNRIRAINYQPFGLRFLTQFARTQVETEAGLISRFQDIGYSAADSALAVKSQLIQARRTNMTSLSAASPTNLKKLYMADRIGQAEVRAWLTYLDYPAIDIDSAIKTWDLLKKHEEKEAGEKEAIAATRKAVIEAYRVGIVDTQTAADHLSKTGYAVKQATALLGAIDVSAKATVVKSGIAAVRKAVLNGRMTLPNARVQLSQIGVTDRRIAEYTSVWEIELQAGRKQLAAGKIIQLAREGLLDPASANERLVNLGYDQPDALLLMAEAVQSEATAEAKLQTAEQRRSEAAAKQIVAMQQRIAAQAVRAQQALAKVTPRSQIVKWFRDGVVSERFVRERLAAMGIPQADIDASIADAIETRKKVVNVQAKKVSSGPFGFKTTTTVS